jgi:hypothetical protein
MENQRRFDLLLAAMPEKVLDQIMDAVENCCSSSMEPSIMFQYIFLQHLLPVTLRTLLGELEPR